MNTASPSPRRRRRSARPPGTPPSVLVDRSLPADLIATTCRGLGWTAVTLVDLYGTAGAEEAEDETWIDHAGCHGLVVLTKDERIARKAVERAAVLKLTRRFSAWSPDDPR